MVVTINDSVLFKGGNTAFSIPVLPFQSNDIKINFVATQYNNVEKLQYSYFLEGYMGKWSEWNTDHKVAFLSLREGRYKFKVKARNIYNSESTEGNYYFRILPPWYRSWWAYTIYVIFGLLLLWLVVKLYTYRLQEQNKRLERIVVERTREVVQQKDKIEI